MGLARRIGVLTAAIFFALVLWAYVHLSGTYEVDVDLPLVIKTPAGFAISNTLPEKIHVRLSGPGWRLLMVNATRNSKLKLDLSERDSKEFLSTFYITKDELLTNSSLPSDVKLIKMEPDSLGVQFSRESIRRVAIEIRTDIQPASGYVIVGDPAITPSTVTLHGSNILIDSIRSFPTKLLRSRGAHESFTQTLELSDTLAEVLTSRSINSVSVHVTIEAVAERLFNDIPVTVEAMPGDRELFLDPAMVSVVVRGGVDQLAKLSRDAIKAKIVYDAIKFDSISTLAPQIDAPTGIEVLQSQPTQVRFVIRKK